MILAQGITFKGRVSLVDCLFLNMKIIENLSNLNLPKITIFVNREVFHNGSTTAVTLDKDVFDCYEEEVPSYRCQCPVLVLMHSM